MYPTSFSWEQRILSVGVQGKCGSCYVFAALKMLEARLNIIHNEIVKDILNNL